MVLPQPLPLTQLANCLYHGPVRAVIGDQCDEVVQSVVNSYLLKSDPSIMEISSALVLNVSHLPEVCVCINSLYMCVFVCVCISMYVRKCCVCVSDWCVLCISATS